MIPEPARRCESTEARGRRHRTIVGRLAACLLLALIAACRPAGSGPPANVVRSERERGPLRLVVEASPPEVLVGDVVRVRVAFEGPQDVAAELPTEQAFGELGAKIADTPAPRPGEKGLLRQREFVLEPLEPGDLAIPVLTVKYGSTTSQPTSAPAMPASPGGELVSEALTVKVRSSLREGEGPGQPRDITGTLTPPEPPMPLWMKLAIVGGIVAVGSLGYWLYRVLRARALRPPPPVPPDAWALGQLDGLSVPDPANRALLAAYYYQLTGVVRTYIERQFGLRAPDMTTEEFLVYVSRDGAGERYQVEHLRAFLEACDLVKYAAWTPTRDDAASALTTARTYVLETAAAVRRAAQLRGQIAEAAAR